MIEYRSIIARRLATGALIVALSVVLAPFAPAVATPPRQPPPSKPSKPPSVRPRIIVPRVERPAQLRVDPRRVPPVRSAALTGATNTLAMVLGDGSAPLWSLGEGRETVRLRSAGGALLALGLGADGTTVLTGGAAGVARLWNATTGAPIGAIRTDGGGIGAVALSPSGRTVVTGSADGTVRLYDRATGEEIRRFPAHRGPVTQLALDGQGQMLASVGADGAVRVWSVGPAPLAANTQVAPLAMLAGAAQAPGMAVAFSPDRRFMAIGGPDGSVTLFDIGAGAPYHRFVEHQGAVGAVAFSSDGRRLATGGLDRAVNLYDIAGKKLLHRFEGLGREDQPCLFPGLAHRGVSGGGGRVVAAHRAIGRLHLADVA